jgi:predicted transcriptional regulator of viral defense system
MTPAQRKAVEILSEMEGVLPMHRILSAGINRNTLYALYQMGILERISHGTYRLHSAPPLEDPDLPIIATKIPHGVICLLSALSLHELTSHIPHEIDLAIPRSARYPSIELPVRFYRYSESSYKEGIEERVMNGIVIRLYNAEKTLADCFKFRNKIGMDLVLEAFKAYQRNRTTDFQKVLYYANLNRVERQMIPYLEALV